MLKIDAGAFTSTVTLGNTSPIGQVLAVATITSSTQALLATARQIIACIEGNAQKIQADHKEFSKLIATKK